jgi:hypothetical protein
VTIIQKLKLLISIRKPVGTITDAFAEVRKTKKYIHFAVTVLGSLLTALLALNGIIPPVYSLIATTVLQALYNIVRGLDKASSEEIKGTVRTTEFWMTGLNEVQKAVLAIQTAGINPEWLAASSTIIGMALAAGQNLAARTPSNTPEIPAKVESTGNPG